MADGGAMGAEPRELADKATGKTVGFFCGQCLSVTAVMLLGAHVGEKDDRIAAAREAAAIHCAPCACGAARRGCLTECDACRSKRQDEEADAKKRTAFEKAEKVAAKDWTGEYVWSDRFEELFDSIGELRGRYEDEGEEPPEFVWECEEEVLVLDATDIFNDALEREGATYMMEHIPPVAFDDLKKALDDWAKKHPVKWWVEAHRRAVLLPEEE